MTSQNDPPPSDRMSQKTDLLIKLGKLFGPLEHIAEHPAKYNEQERAEVIAGYSFEHQLLIRDFIAFSTQEYGRNYRIQYKKFHFALDQLENRVVRGDDLRRIVTEQKQLAIEAIDAIPVPQSSVILDAGSPFTAYCKLRSLCEADTSNSIRWFDPFFGSEVFYRYLQFVPVAVSIVIVACEPAAHASKKDRARWEAFLDISRSFARERGVSDYRLLVSSSLHDRWLVIDEKRIYALGGSAKDAGSKDYFTIAGVTASTENLQKIDAIISAATEWFGPATPNHR